jgi:hypothetical protein
MTQSIDVHVEDGAEATSQRSVAAWHRAERGEPVDEHHLSFPMQVAADVEALTESGLIDRSKAGLRVDYSEIRARIAV